MRHPRHVAGAELASSHPRWAAMDQPTQSSVLNATRFLDRAEEAQTQAQHIKYMILPRTRVQILKLAEIYRRMAEIALQYPTIPEDQVDLSG